MKIVVIFVVYSVCLSLCCRSCTGKLSRGN